MPVWRRPQSGPTRDAPYRSIPVDAMASPHAVIEPHADETCRSDSSHDEDCECFRCKVRTIGFTFRGAHLGRKGWNEGTVSEYKREVYEGARETGQDITRVH